MVCISRCAVECPYSSCDFAYFASHPDPAGKLRNHFNNLKSRDAEHEAFFQKPSCVFCGETIISKTRKGLWKTEMNKHWLINHSDKFSESVEPQAKQDMEVALILSTKQLEMLANEWQWNYELDEGDLIVRKGKRVQLRASMVIARILAKDRIPSPCKRRRISTDQLMCFNEPSQGVCSTGDEIYPAPSHALPEHNSVVDEVHRRTNAAQLPELGTMVVAGDQGSADAFTAMTYCFQGFEDDLAGAFNEPTNGDAG